jgi:hypothetical protein
VQPDVVLVDGMEVVVTLVTLGDNEVEVVTEEGRLSRQVCSRLFSMHIAWSKRC